MAYQIVDNVGVQIQGLVVGNFYSPSANPLPGQGNLPMPGDIFSVIFVVGNTAIINVMQGAHQGQMNIARRNYPPNTLFKKYALAGGAGLPPVARVAGENNSMGNNKPNNKSSQRRRKHSRKNRRTHKKTRKN